MESVSKSCEHKEDDPAAVTEAVMVLTGAKNCLLLPCFRDPRGSALAPDRGGAGVLGFIFLV